MKKLKTKILSSFLLSCIFITLIYLFTSFSNWEFDPSKWSEACRVFVSIFSITSIMISINISEQIF